MSRTKIAILKQYLLMALFVVLVRLVFRFIFGDRSLESSLQALIDGAKLAAWVLGFGILNLIVNFRKLLNLLPKSLRFLTTPLGIAFSLTPELANSMIRIRNNSKLRAHRRGVHYLRSVLVPMVSSAIDQAMNLADSMQARGYSNPRDSIALKNLHFAYPSGKKVLRNVSFEASPGSFTIITGATGSGKSTLLKVIQAKLPGVAFVGQFPRQTFVAETVHEELAFSLEESGLSKSEIQTSVTELAAKFGLELGANPFELSAGWQQRLAIAAALGVSSKILILDEPFSALDDEGTNELLTTLGDLKASGTTIVIAEHRVQLLTDLADRILHIQGGLLLPAKIEMPSLTKSVPTTGKVTALFGMNGSGKTTYLRKLAESSGVLVPQPASDLLFLDTIEAEFRQADLDAKQPAGTAEAIAKKFNFQFEPNQNPRDLSEGQKLTLALAIQLAKPANLLLLDEPTLGFDTASRQALAETIQGIAETGVEVIVATHDREFATAVATASINIDQVVANAR